MFSKVLEIALVVLLISTSVLFMALSYTLCMPKDFIASDLVRINYAD